MRIPDMMDKVVVFIGPESQYGFIPYGTALLGTVQRKECLFPFLVTARHVVDQIPGDRVYYRINRKEGDCMTASVLKTEAIGHVDASNDLVVIPVKIDFSSQDFRTTPLDRKFTESQRDNSWAPGVGDEVAIIGLYTSHYGHTKNVPVARIGNIALMPGEPVSTGAGYALAYLIEVRSIAGLSGSPVFIMPPDIKVDEKGQPSFRTGQHVSIIGILIGYHLVQSTQDQIAVPQFPDENQGDDRPIPENRNTGLAVVIPIERVLEIVESPEILSRLDLGVEAYRKASGYRPASSFS